MSSTAIQVGRKVPDFIYDFLPTREDVVDFVDRWKNRETEEGEVIFCTLTFTQSIIFICFGEALFHDQPALHVMASLGTNKLWAFFSLVLLVIRSIGLLKKKLRARKLAAFLSMFLWYISAACLLLGGAIFMGFMYLALASNTAGVFLRLTKRKV